MEGLHDVCSLMYGVWPKDMAAVMAAQYDQAVFLGLVPIGTAEDVVPVERILGTVSSA